VRGLVTTPPTIMGKVIVPAAREKPVFPRVASGNRNKLKTCHYYSGIIHTENRKCCGGKIQQVHFFKCTMDNQEREIRVCMFCPHYKEKPNDTGDKGSTTTVPGVEQPA